MTPEESFEKNVGDDKLFPNHTDKDIWVSGYTQCQEDMADKDKRIKQLEEVAIELFNLIYDDSDLTRKQNKADDLYNIIKP